MTTASGAAAIQVAGVGKRFRLYHEKYQSLKERVIHFGRIPHEDFWALRDIDLEIAEGETFGLLGHNGSGKSTLLKCIAGIITPTHGEITTVGRLAALLELGAGFHPDLTGRENVFLNASILGFSNREIARRFDEIVQFAELEQFIDNQVKHYSSGMYVRLGFAVAIHMDPEVLLIDEVLAVGDEAFQRKCLDRIRQFQREGRTIVFVTHNAALVPQICDRAAVLDHGALKVVGAPGDAVRALRESLFSVAPDSEGSDVSAPTLGVTIQRVDVEFAAQGDRPYLLPGEPLTIRVHFFAPEPVVEPVFGIAIADDAGTELFGTNTEILDTPLGVLQGSGSVAFHIVNIPFLDGSYPVTVGITDERTGVVYDWWDNRVRFQVANPGRAAGKVALEVRIAIDRGQTVDVEAGEAAR